MKMIGIDIVDGVEMIEIKDKKFLLDFKMSMYHTSIKKDILLIANSSQPN